MPTAVGERVRARTASRSAKAASAARAWLTSSSDLAREHLRLSSGKHGTILVMPSPSSRDRVIDVASGGADRHDVRPSRPQSALSSDSRDRASGSMREQMWIASPSLST